MTAARQSRRRRANVLPRSRTPAADFRTTSTGSSSRSSPPRRSERHRSRALDGLRNVKQHGGLPRCRARWVEGPSLVSCRWRSRRSGGVGRGPPAPHRRQDDPARRGRRAGPVARVLREAGHRVLVAAMARKRSSWRRVRRDRDLTSDAVMPRLSGKPCATRSWPAARAKILFCTGYSFDVLSDGGPRGGSPGVAEAAPATLLRRCGAAD